MIKSLFKKQNTCNRYIPFCFSRSYQQGDSIWIPAASTIHTDTQFRYGNETVMLTLDKRTQCMTDVRMGGPMGRASVLLSIVFMSRACIERVAAVLILLLAIIPWECYDCFWTTDKCRSAHTCINLLPSMHIRLLPYWLSLSTGQHSWFLLRSRVHTG